MKNIALIIDSLAGGGAERVVISLAEYLANQGHAVTIFSLKRVKQYKVPAKVQLVYPFKENTKLRGWFNRKSLAKQLEIALIKQEQQTAKFDLIVVNLHESYKIVSACDFNNVFYVIHNSIVQELKREKLMGPIKYFYMRHILKMLNDKNLIGVSKGVTQEIEKSSFVHPKSLLHIYNPFDKSSIEQQSKHADVVDIKDKYVLHVGRAAKAKRHDVLFQAFQSVDPEYKLVCLAGNTRKLQKLGEKYGIENRLVLPGFSSNPYAWMKNASVLVLSSDYEGLSLVLIESLICKTKVVSTDCPFGPNEILTGNLTKFLVKPGDSDGLAQAINNALAYTLKEEDFAILDEVGIEKIAEKYLSLCEV